jgi:hypothetical protein
MNILRFSSTEGGTAGKAMNFRAELMGLIVCLMARFSADLGTCHKTNIKLLWQPNPLSEMYQSVKHRSACHIFGNCFTDWSRV